MPTDRCYPERGVNRAQMNMRLALERRSESEQVLPGIRLVVG